LSSPPFNVKLSVPLPSSCNAAPLIATATTQHKEVAFRQPITQYQILCCYRVSRLGLLNGQWLRELVRVDKKMLGAMSDYPNNRPLTFWSEFGIYSQSVFSSVTEAQNSH